MKLSAPQIKAIYRSPCSHALLARMYGVSAVMVYYIRTGRRCSSITGHRNNDERKDK